MDLASKQFKKTRMGVFRDLTLSGVKFGKDIKNLVKIFLLLYLVLYSVQLRELYSSGSQSVVCRPLEGHMQSTAYSHHMSAKMMFIILKSHQNNYIYRINILINKDLYELCNFI